MTGPVGPNELLNLDSTSPTGPIPPGASGDTFDINYTNIAKVMGDIERVNLTFSDFNESRRIRFFQESFNVVWKQETEERIDLGSFFYPLQDFSGYQKQTFVIKPNSYFKLDPGYFSSTSGEVGFIFARAYYLVETEENEKVLYWTYGPSGGQSSYVMRDFLSLSGAIKSGDSWNGWDTDQIYFTNPTPYSVKLKIISAN